MPNPLHDARYQIFREMLANARSEKGLLQTTLAERMGRPQSFVSKYERGDRRLDMPEFLEVAEALGIDVESFIQLYRTKLARISSSRKES